MGWALIFIYYLYNKTNSPQCIYSDARMEIHRVSRVERKPCMPLGQN